MPVGPGLAGYVTIYPSSPTGELIAATSVTTLDYAGLSATVTIDSSSVDAWDATATSSIDSRALHRSGLKRGCRVLLFGEDITAKIYGDVVVSISEDSLIPDASFSIAGDPRVNFFDAQTWMDGAVPCQIYLRSRTQLAYHEELLFDGFTDAPSTDGDIDPIGHFKAIGKVSLWANRKGCVRIPAFAGHTYQEILELFAASCGVTISGTMKPIVVYRAYDISGITVIELARQFAEICGAYVSVDPTADATLVLIDQASRIALDVVPAWTHTAANVLSFSPEEAPNRPTTSWYFKGTSVSKEFLAEDDTQTLDSVELEGTDSSGPWLVRTTTRKRQGVVLMTDIQEFRVITLIGVTNSTEYAQAKRVITTNDYLTISLPAATGFVTRMTPQLRSRSLETYLPDSPQAANGAVRFLWTDGTHHTGSIQAPLLVNRMTETYDWISGGDRKCQLRTKTLVTETYYDPLSDTGLDPDTNHLYDDGSHRSSTAYSLMETARQVEEWYDTVTPVESRLFWKNTLDSKYETTSGTVVSGILRPKETYFTRATPSPYNSEEPPRASSEQPIYEQRTWTAIYDSDDGTYARTQSPDTMLPHVEDAQVALAVGKYRAIRNYAAATQVSHPALPWSLLKLYDPTRVIDVPRETDEVGITVASQWTITPQTGAAYQLDRVRFIPRWPT